MNIKKLKSWSMLMLAAMALPMMVACGDDGDGGGAPSTGKRLVRVTDKGEKNTYVFEYSYDSQGRVVRIDRKKNGETDHYYTYAYYNDKIVKNSHSSGSTRQTEYILENGFIVSEKHQSESDNVQYTYANNHLATITSYNKTRKYNWSGGNLMSIESGDDIETMEYTSYLTPESPLILWDLDEPLAKYFGITTRNLPSKFVDGNEMMTYDWTMEGGLPVKLILTESYKSDASTSIITYEWQ